MPANESYNFRPFTDHIDTTGVVGAERLAGLADDGYVAVVNLLPDDSEYAVNDEKEIVESQNLHYHHRPVDFAAPTQQDYEWFESIIKSLPEEKTLLHCAANYRVSAFAAIYAVRNLGWTPESARAFVADIWDISDYPLWASFLSERISR